MSIPGLTVIETPSMVVDGVRYVEAPSDLRNTCIGCAFEKRPCSKAVLQAGEVFGGNCGERRVIYVRADSPKQAEPTIAHTMLALKLTAILDRAKRIAGESITSGAAAVHAAYTGALRTEFEHLLEDMEHGE